jgi:hypothetical protein
MERGGVLYVGPGGSARPKRAWFRLAGRARRNDQEAVMIRTILALAGAFAVGMAAGFAPAGAQDEDANSMTEERFVGTFSDVNPNLGAPPVGMVSIRRKGDEVEFNLRGTGFDREMHLVHVHGFAEADPRESVCPTMEADTNDDGVVDLIETRPIAGVTMVPFTDDPASLTIKSESYPKPNEDGKVTYRKTIDFGALEKAMQETFGTPPALERRVVFIHGVTEDTDLPDTVQSLEGVPARVTVPVACAEL